MNGDDENVGFWGGLGAMIKGGWEGGKKKIGDAATDLSVAGLEKVVKSEAGQKYGAALISEAVKESAEEITDNAGSLVKEGKSLLKRDESNPNASSYEIIRESLKPAPDKPQDGLIKGVFKSIVARVLDAGAGIAGWIGATFVNTIFKPTDKVDALDVKDVFASFMSKIFGGDKKKKA